METVSINNIPLKIQFRFEANEFTIIKGNNHTCYKKFEKHKLVVEPKKTNWISLFRFI